MERKFLEGLDLDKKGTKLDKEAVETIMAEHGKSVEKQKTENATLVAERDGIKTQLDDVTKKLGEFEGVDLETLKKEIETLKGDITSKETDFAKQLAERDFQALVNAGISAEKGLNPKAIAALLDVETLKSSKNQKEDIATALKAVRESDAYLFEKAENKDEDTPAHVSSGGSHNEEGAGSSKNTNDFMNAQIRGESKGD